ncbi:MAG: PQQ-binding-like beta-propeller repeat protein, partial [Planctomycetales bacterium]|nr:PQQ-binding-like beta-propeller repeat protein [Planctomycetales bacterium]
METAVQADDWPQWRGVDRTDVSSETGLLKAWPDGGPPLVWLYKNAGNGYSGPAIVAGRLYTLGTRDDKEVLLSLDADTGEELWCQTIGEILDNGWGDGPRGTPTIDGDRIYAMSGQGVVVCCNLDDGQLRWQVSMEKLGGEIPQWGYTESVLVDGEHVLCTPGGKDGAMVALNKMSGEVVWQSSEFTDGAQYSSIIPIEHEGVRSELEM